MPSKIFKINKDREILNKPVFILMELQHKLLNQSAKLLRDIEGPQHLFD